MDEVFIKNVVETGVAIHLYSLYLVVIGYIGIYPATVNSRWFCLLLIQITLNMKQSSFPPKHQVFYMFRFSRYIICLIIYSQPGVLIVVGS